MSAPVGLVRSASAGAAEALGFGVAPCGEALHLILADLRDGGRRELFRWACVAHRGLDSFLPLLRNAPERPQLQEWVGRNAKPLHRTLERLTDRSEYVVTLRAQPPAAVPPPGTSGSGWLRARAEERRRKGEERAACRAALERCAADGEALGAEAVALDDLEDGAELVLFARRSGLPAFGWAAPPRAVVSGPWPPCASAARCLEAMP